MEISKRKNAKTLGLRVENEELCSFDLTSVIISAIDASLEKSNNRYLGSFSAGPGSFELPCLRSDGSLSYTIFVRSIDQGFSLSYRGKPSIDFIENQRAKLVAELKKYK